MHRPRASFAFLIIPASALTAACSSAGLHAGGKDAGSPLVDAAADVANPEDLAPPPLPQGVQMKTAPFTVPPGTEQQNCYFFRVSDLAQAAGYPAGQALNVHRVEIVQRAGSHHMNIFRVRTIAGLDPTKGAVQTATNGQGACFVSSNWADWPLVANTQQAGDQDWSYPDGVANVLNAPDYPDEWLMLQSHFVNASTQTTQGDTGQVAVNLWTLPADQVTAQLGTLFATDQNIRVCQSNPTPTFAQGCQFNSSSPVTIVGANGHFHSRGKEFDIYTWDGKSLMPDTNARFYQSVQWDDPPMLHSPELEVSVPANGGVYYSCTYDWQAPPSTIGCSTLNTIDQQKEQAAGTTAQADCCYRFGPQVDTNEHCNAFVYYYPKLSDATCF